VGLTAGGVAVKTKTKIGDNAELNAGIEIRKNVNPVGNKN